MNVVVVTVMNLQDMFHKRNFCQKSNPPDLGGLQREVAS